MSRSWGRNCLPGRQRGVSLVDTMSATAVGVVTLGSVAILSVAAARSHAEAVRQSQLEGWLRATVVSIEQDVRDAAPAEDEGAGDGVQVSAQGDCLQIRRSAAGVVGWTGYRVRFGADGHGRLERRRGTQPFQCEHAADWRPLSDPAQVDIDAASFVLDRRSAPVAFGGSAPGLTLVEIDLRVVYLGSRTQPRTYRAVVRAGDDRSG